MPRIRCIEIKNFRGIREFQWFPSSGLNCLIGPGDSGKSTILEAIDLCLGARRNPPFSDADFHRLDVESPIIIEVTLGELDDSLKNFDSYGLYLRGYDDLFGIQDEPEADSETVLTIQLKIDSDLEPVWSLISDRATAQGQTRMLSWADRLRLSPARIGAFANYDLSWRKGSVLNRLSEERADASAALARVARDARSAFGDNANGQLAEARMIVAATAKDLGVRVGDEVKALLDPDSLSFGGGTIALHDQNGVPLRNLGVGSTRLLIAGLQRKAAASASIIIVDELEHGLEPHRLVRFIGSLGAKEKKPPLQVFVTTHSPAAVRELSGDQLFIVRRTDNCHSVRRVGLEDAIQGTTRLFPEAFLAPKVIVCEGATEVGFIRGFDQYRTAKDCTSILTHGVALVDGNGITNVFGRALAFQSLGFRTAVFCDADEPAPAKEKQEFLNKGGTTFCWRDGKAIEDELFACLSDEGALKLLDKATEFHGEALVTEHIKNASNGELDLSACQENLTQAVRKVLGRAAKEKKRSGVGWFKSVSHMEEAAREIIALDFKAEVALTSLIADIFKWTHNGSAS